VSLLLPHYYIYHCQTPQYIEFTKQEPLDLRATIFTAAGADAMNLLLKLLVLQPSQRITAAEALQHEYFTNAPLPSDPSALSLPIPVSSSAVHACTHTAYAIYK
jgi:cyclin-dependent kinase 7